MCFSDQGGEREGVIGRFVLVFFFLLAGEKTRFTTKNSVIREYIALLRANQMCKDHQRFLNGCNKGINRHVMELKSREIRNP